MFTGIVQAVGEIKTMRMRRGGAQMEIAAPAAMLKRLGRGDSVAVNGCCLTVTRKQQGVFAADLSKETLARTALGSYRTGARVNLEPSLRLGDEMGGHMMQGHVEATGRLLDLRALEGDAGWWLEVILPPELLPLVVSKGSLAVDGISLTVAVLEGARAGFAIIPHTWQHTHLRWLQAGAAVNIETDPIARHVQRLLEARGAGNGRAGLSVAGLRRQGF